MNKLREVLAQKEWSFGKNLLMQVELNNLEQNLIRILYLHKKVMQEGLNMRAWDLVPLLSMVITTRNSIMDTGSNKQVCTDTK